MEEIKEAQLRQDRVQVGVLVDPTVEALDALRQAVVAQTALLRSLSEQIRLGFEFSGHSHAEIFERLAGLAERLEKLEQHFTSGPSWTQGFTTAAKQYNEELTGHLQAIEAKLSAKDTQSRSTIPSRARRKAKR